MRDAGAKILEPRFYIFYKPGMEPSVTLTKKKIIELLSAMSKWKMELFNWRSG